MFSSVPKTVSIVIPTYNNLSLLEQTLNSIIQQTYPYWEAIVIDDCSTDGTQEKLQQLALKEPRIVYLNHKQGNQGANICRNLGIEKSTGDYIIFLDSDDLLSENCLETRVTLMQNHPDIDFGIFSCQLFSKTPGDDNRLWNVDTEEDDIDRFLKIDVPWQTSSPIWRKRSLLTLGNWDEELLSWQDWELHLRALIRGFKYQKFSLVDCFWRLPGPDKKTIGSNSTSPAHLESHKKLLEKIYTLLKLYNQFNFRRKYLLAGVFFWLSNKWTDKDQIQNGVLVWKRCYSLGLIDFREYMEGLLYLRTKRVRGLARITNKYLNWQWKSKSLREVFQSKTFRKYKI